MSIPLSLGPLALGGGRQRVHAHPMGRMRRVADQWQRSICLPWVRLVGGLLVLLAGVWVVVAGPLFHQLWLDVIGAAMLILGSYILGLGFKGINERPGRHHMSRS